MHVPLWQGIAANDARGTERALRRGAEVDYRGAGGLTPLLAAAERGALPTAALLLQHRASVDMADDRGRTPLMLAARSPNDELVAALLEAHATPSPSLSVSLSLTPTLTPDPNP
jgi:ankyrin repeat protein